MFSKTSLVLTLITSIAAPLFAAEDSKPSSTEPKAATQGVKLPPAKLIRSARSGAWSSTDTWEGNKVPSSGNQVLIREGHQVVYDVSSDNVIRSLHISGTLTFAHDKDTFLNVGLVRIEAGDKVIEEGFDCDHVPDAKKLVAAAKDGGQPGFSAICVCCESKAALLVGTPEQPIDADHTAKIRLHYVNGMDPKSMPAIVCCGGRMDFHGAPMDRTWVKLNSNIVPRDGEVTQITLDQPVSGWRVGDEIIVTGTVRANVRHTNDRFRFNTEKRIITAIDGDRLTVDKPFERDHVGEGDFRAEVANLSRNVIVESAAPDGVRGHTMYHVGSAGSISYAEFRHLGKKDELGRYGIHFHLVGDTMRGSSVIGASIHDSHNRWITVHGTQYLVVRDCVGYQSIGHGFFLEDGTEVYNTFDRNLACQALRGNPLPEQVLPYDPNDGAGFWWANSLNTFTRNVGVECETYGFRFQATPKAGVSDRKNKVEYGDVRKPFDLTMPVRQPDGSQQSVDIRTLPFVRFEGNESHSNGRWGLNLGQGNGQVGPDASTPFVIRDMKIWQVVGGWGVDVPNVLIDGMVIHEAGYGVRESRYVQQDYRNVSINSRGATVASLDDYLNSTSAANGQSGRYRRLRQPGWPEGGGDGGPAYQSAEIEVAELNPVDNLPPTTVITSVRQLSDGRLQVRGTTSDNADVETVTVNGEQARALSQNFSQWEAKLPMGKSESIVELTAIATDAAGNAEETPHVMNIFIE